MKTNGHAPPRRVLMLVENLPSPFDRRVWQEACTLRDAGYLVSIICPSGPGYPPGFEDLEDIHIHRYQLPLEASGAKGYALEYGAALFHTLRLMLRVWQLRGFDIIHACNPPDLFFLFGILTKPFGVKFLFDHHDLCPELYEAKFGRRDFFYKLMRWLEYCTFRVADLSIATNESYRRIAIERGRMPPDRVAVVRSGPDLQRIRRAPPDENLKRGRRFLVGYVGVMGKQEGLDLLLEAVWHLVYRHKRQDIQFALAGSGTSLEEMRALARHLGVADYVSFTGRIPDGELMTLLSTADACVNPDAANELNDKSTMNKTMEYMALGKPLVQFDLTEGRRSALGASLYAARDDPADFADKLVRLLDDEPLRAEMGNFGRRRVETELGWHREAPKLLAAYESLWRGAAIAEPNPAE